MAEFLVPTPQAFPSGPGDGFNAMGKTIPSYRRQAGYETCKEMGCGTETAWSAVNGMAESLERDQPYQAMAAGMRWLDLTGTYRLMAVLLTAEKPKVKVKAA